MRRRLLLALCAVALASSTAPADAASGELVVTGSGASYAVLDLPNAVALDSGNVRVTTRGRYAVLVVEQARRVRDLVVLHPNSHGVVSAQLEGLPRGRSTVRVLSDGPVTFRIGARGLRRAISVRADRRLAGTTATVRSATPTGTGEVADSIAFDVRRGLVVHGYEQEYADLGVARTESFCLSHDASGCGPVGSPEVSPATAHTTWQAYDTWLGPGRSYGHYRAVEVAAGTMPATHYLFAIPLE